MKKSNLFSYLVLSSFIIMGCQSTPEQLSCPELTKGLPSSPINFQIGEPNTSKLYDQLFVPGEVVPIRDEQVKKDNFTGSSLFDPNYEIVFGNPEIIIPILRENSIAYTQCPCKDSLFLIDDPYHMGVIQPRDEDGGGSGGVGDSHPLSISLIGDDKEHQFGYEKTITDTAQLKFIRSQITINTDSTYKIAIIDTGNDQIAEVENETECDTLTNLVDLNNKPFDDSKNMHGTNIDLLIHDVLERLEISDISTFHIKAFDSTGRGNLFNVACGLYTAREMGANMINCSFGFYTCDHYQIPFLRKVINEVSRDVMIVGSAGNRTYWLEDYGNYPSEYDSVAQIISIRQAQDTLSIFSNANANYNVAFYGELRFVDDQFAPSPFSSAELIGTSFAAPQAAVYFLSLLRDHPRVLNKGYINTINPKSSPVFSNGPQKPITVDLSNKTM